MPHRYYSGQVILSASDARNDLASFVHGHLKPRYGLSGARYFAGVDPGEMPYWVSNPRGAKILYLDRTPVPNTFPIPYGAMVDATSHMSNWLMSIAGYNAFVDYKDITPLDPLHLPQPLQPSPSPIARHVTGAGGLSFEEAWAHAEQKVTLGPDGKPLSGPDPIEKIRGELSRAGATIVGACAPETTSVVIKAAIQGGRAVGVSVYAVPPSSTVSSCVAARVRSLTFTASGYMDAVTASF